MEEPTSKLDLIAMTLIEDIITELSEKLTIVIVTHNVQRVTRPS